MSMIPLAICLSFDRLQYWPFIQVINIIKRPVDPHLAASQPMILEQTWGQFNSGIGIDGQFQFQFRNCLFEKIIELELNWN